MKDKSVSFFTFLEMSLYYSIFILFSMLSWIVSCESPILSLDSDTYHDIIDSHSDIIVKHYTSVWNSF